MSLFAIGFLVSNQKKILDFASKSVYCVRVARKGIRPYLDLDLAVGFAQNRQVVWGGGSRLFMRLRRMQTCKRLKVLDRTTFFARQDFFIRKSRCAPPPLLESRGYANHWPIASQSTTIQPTLPPILLIFQNHIVIDRAFHLHQLLDFDALD